MQRLSYEGSLRPRRNSCSDSMNPVATRTFWESSLTAVDVLWGSVGRVSNRMSRLLHQTVEVAVPIVQVRSSSDPQNPSFVARVLNSNVCLQFYGKQWIARGQGQQYHQKLHGCSLSTFIPRLTSMKGRRLNVEASDLRGRTGVVEFRRAREGCRPWSPVPDAIF